MTACLPCGERTPSTTTRYCLTCFLTADPPAVVSAPTVDVAHAIATPVGASSQPDPSLLGGQYPDRRAMTAGTVVPVGVASRADHSGPLSAAASTNDARPIYSEPSMACAAGGCQYCLLPSRCSCPCHDTDKRKRRTL